MQASESPPELDPTLDHQEASMARLSRVIHHASDLLPAQGPITVFIHHNTLHAFEDLPFDEAVKKGAQLFGCQPYMTEERYRADFLRGRIGVLELREVLQDDLGERMGGEIPCFGSRLELRLAMLQYPLRTGPTEELVWYVAEADALRRIRPEVSSAVRSRMIAETRRWVVRDLRGGIDPSRNRSPRPPDSLADLFHKFSGSTIEDWSEDRWESFTLQALWRVCCDGVRDLPPFTTPPPRSIRHRDLLFEATGADSDAKVHKILIRFCAAYLDQGMARWSLPSRDLGFFAAFCSLYRDTKTQPDRWLRGLGAELARLQDAKTGPLDSISESLGILGVCEEEWEGFLASTFLALRGWGGMLSQIETHGDRAVHPIQQGSLLEFLAVRLILDRFALAETARDAINYEGSLSLLRIALRGRLVSDWPPSVEQRAFLVFQLGQLFGLSPDSLHHLSRPEWARLVEELESFSGVERRRIFHLAYEKRFTNQTLDAIALRAREKVGRPASPKFQVVCCIDEREESFRRNLEEIAPEVETFGVAGFYNVAMYYRGAADAHFVPLCPAIHRPQHWVIEEANDLPNKFDRIKAQTRKAFGAASHQFHVGSRSFALGALLTGAVGPLASFPLVARILFPRLAGQIRHSFGRIVRTSPRTRLKLERTDAVPGPEGKHVGFSVDEMIDISERLLRDMGLTSGFARLIILIGHGSHSQNNPHDSAYNCGVCGGSAGGPNARVVAQFLSDPRIRQALASRGLVIPDESVFLGGSHNTCDDSVTYYDVGRIEESHKAEFESAREALGSACERNAHERCRRFKSAPLGLSFEDALEHVEQRSEDLAQTRPELGHATNAITIVGRREWTRGLFLDRRSFLTSYDPSTDDLENSILARVLGAVFPVCSGISLEYYFSNIDNNGYGCGTKLPHNLASLLGVMDGSASDLRTGLPWQMVEIHEPVRSLFLIETTAQSMLGIMGRSPGIDRLCRNDWIQLALLHPTDRTISVFRDGGFEPHQLRTSALPRAASSADWYRGYRDHLEFAEIGA